MCPKTGPGRPADADHVVVAAVNDEGDVFGHALYATGAASRAVRWDSGQWVELGDVLGGGRTEVTGATNLTSDLTLDSFQVMEFLMEIEDALDIAVDMNSLSDVHTVSDLATVVASRVNA
jgi:acyl carrier protein